MEIGTAMILIAIGVFFYKKPVVFKWSAIVAGVLVVVFVGSFAYEQNHKPVMVAKTPSWVTNPNTRKPDDLTMFGIPNKGDRK
jgi:hypothetical protein